jgi:glycosyltransferase involved in cell wall biosynthesis
MVWEGPQFVQSSLAKVNREIALALTDSGRCELSLIPQGSWESAVAEDSRFENIRGLVNKPVKGGADIFVRHHWPPNFSRPPHGEWVLMQPWEYGSMPAAWLPHLKNEVDEVWVYSHYNKNCYVEDGVPHEKISVIPLAVDLKTFRTGLESWSQLQELAERKTIFLFVGGTIWRKGIDVLLDAFTRAFSRQDDVALVIKDMGQDSFYKGQTAGATIQRIQENTKSPEIVYITQMLSDVEIARLYATCHCLVHPYRGEGFGLPVAEAMATGLPVILSKGGACDDFAADENVYWVETRRAWIQMKEPMVRRPWVLQPDCESLVAQMRYVVEHREEAQKKGMRAAAYIRDNLSWERTAATILDRSGVLKERRFGSDDNAFNINKRAKDLVEAGREEEAIKELLRAIQLAPHWGEPWSNLAVIFWNRNEHEKAISCLTSGLKSDSDSVDLLVNYALMSNQMGYGDKAAQVLRNFLNRHPDETEIEEVLRELQ